MHAIGFTFSSDDRFAVDYAVRAVSDLASFKKARVVAYPMPMRDGKHLRRIYVTEATPECVESFEGLLLPANVDLMIITRRDPTELAAR